MQADDGAADPGGPSGDHRPAPDDDLAALVDRVPPGWTPVVWAGHRYGLRRTDAAGGGAGAIVAEQLGGTDLVSTNVYRTATGALLRPCEMPAEKVLAFLRDWVAAPAPDRGRRVGVSHWD